MNSEMAPKELGKFSPEEVADALAEVKSAGRPMRIGESYSASRDKQKLLFEETKQKKLNEIRQSLGLPAVLEEVAEIGEKKLENPTGEELFDSPNLKNGLEKISSVLLGATTVDGVDWETIKTHLYQALTRRGDYENLVQEISTPENRDVYNALAESVTKKAEGEGMTVKYEPAWLHIVTNPAMKGKIESVSKKRYVTISPTAWRSVGKLDVLASKLREVARAENDSIEVKVPSRLSGFVGHNDSFVIHFKKPDSAAKIDNAISEFLSGEGVAESYREYGRAKFAEDSSDTSFSDIVAAQAVEWAKNNYGSMGSKQLAKEIIKKGIELSSR
jgi:hypothetical protein